MRRIFVVDVEDKPGVLNRVASLFRRRAFNIESLTVGHTERPGVSRMTILVDTDETGARRAEANLYKLMHVMRVHELTELATVVRELALVKVKADGTTRAQLVQVADVFRASVVDVAPDSLTIEVTGTQNKIHGLLDVLRPHGILEMVRTGTVAMTRGTAAAGTQPRVVAGETEAEEDDDVSMSV
jgi:acetolactate synthase-1/3 small subunit